MPQVPKLNLSVVAAQSRSHVKNRAVQKQEALADFQNFWGDDDLANNQGDDVPMDDAPSFEISTPRRASQKEPLELFNLGTPRSMSPKREARSFCPPWPYSSQWPFNRAPTTMELKNIPDNMTEDGLAQFLDNLGLSGMYNFIYVPCDAQTQKGLGFAILNADRHADGCKIAGCLHQLSYWEGYGKCSPCAVSWCFACQGVEHLMQHCINAWHMGPDGSYKGPWLRSGDYWVALPEVASWYATPPMSTMPSEQMW